MISDEPEERKTGHPKAPQINGSILAVTAFVEKHLVEFSNRYSGSTITDEDGLSQKLCILLNNNINNGYYSFWFKSEYLEEPERGNSPKVDVAVISSQTGGIVIDSILYSNEESFFSMEAKRLDKLPEARTKEYLVGRVEQGKYRNCGGVERFKSEKHGKGLKYCAIIGYVQKYDFDYWRNTINLWIDALIAETLTTITRWTEKDNLSEENIGTVTARFKSENPRKTDSIILFHLWVNLVK